MCHSTSDAYLANNHYKALVWFATHFIDIAKILAERNGVVSLHLAAEVRLA
jgi:hypothetical protein